MNPYLSTPLGYQSYHPNQFPMSNRITSQPQPTNIQFQTNIENMYVNVQPYTNQQFLIRTFGERIDYVPFFMSLSHEDKLKLFMLMEQKRLTGSMGDTYEYQRILKLIATKVQNYQNFHNKNHNTVNKELENKNKELQNKINLIVDTTFQKLNVASNQIEKQQKINQHTSNFEEDQFVQAQIVQNISNNTEIINNDNHQDIFPTPNKNHEQKKQTEVAHLNFFNFGSDIDSALTKQIGIKTIHELQKKSIWDLQQQQISTLSKQPNLKQIFKKQSIKQNNTQFNQNNIPQISTNNIIKQNFNLFQIQKQNIQYSTSKEIYSSNNFDISSLYGTSKSFSNNTTYNSKEYKMMEPLGQQYFQNNNLQSNLTNITQKNMPKSTDIQQNYNNLTQIDIFAPAQIQITPNYQSNLPKIDLLQPNLEDNNIINLQTNLIQQFTSPEQTINNTNMNKSSQIIQNPAYVQDNININLQQQEQEWNQGEIIQPILNNHLNIQQLIQKQEQVSCFKTQTINYEQNFDFLSSSNNAQNQPQNNQNSKIDFNLNFEDLSILSNFDNNINIPNIKNQNNSLKITIQDPPMDQSLNNSQLFSERISNKYTFLQPLIVKLSPQESNFLQKQLKNRSFECNPIFYETIINFLRKLSLQDQHLYTHFSNQHKLSTEIHEETIRYTKAVNEDQQQNVQRSVMRTKQLFKQIEKTSKTSQSYVKTLLNQNCKQKGLLYKLATILIQSCGKHDYIQKIIQNNDKEAILNSFVHLYVIQKISSLQQLVINSEKIIKYFMKMAQHFKSIKDQNLLKMKENLNQFNKIKIYLQGIRRLCIITQRLILLLKICSLKCQINFVKSSKICKDIRAKLMYFDIQIQKSQMTPKQFTNLLVQSTKINRSVYDLHIQFTKLLNQLPLCNICFLKIFPSQGGQIQNKNYHHTCYQLIQKINIQQQNNYS